MVITHFDTIIYFNMNQITFKVVWLIHVKEGNTVRKQSNKRIGMKQLSPAIRRICNIMYLISVPFENNGRLCDDITGFKYFAMHHANLCLFLNGTEIPGMYVRVMCCL